MTLQATGGIPPLKWTAPSLPTGLSLDTTTGVISGRPTTALPKTPYKVTVTDSATPTPSSTTKDVTLEIKQ
jgi:hypothetical protein